LHAHATVVARSFALLGSAMPHAFGHDRGEVNADFWVLVHMLFSSDCGAFIEQVLDSCSRSRLHDATDLQALDEQLFGGHRPEDSRRRGRALQLADVRLALCHVLLLLFHVLERLHHRAGQLDCFADRSVDLMRLRLLPALRRALDGGVASRWPGVREALGALASAVERAPLPAEDCEWLRGVRIAFRKFAAERFVPAEGFLSTVEAEVQLDPLGHARAVSAAESPKAAVAREAKAVMPAVPAAAPPAATVPRSSSFGLKAERPLPFPPSPGEPISSAALAGLTPITVTPPRSAPEPLGLTPRTVTTPRSAGDLDRVRPPSGPAPRAPSPRRQDVKATGFAEAAGRRTPPVLLLRDSRSMLPKPLPSGAVPDRAEGSLTATQANKRALHRMGLPPLSARSHNTLRSAEDPEFVS